PLAAAADVPAQRRHARLGTPAGADEPALGQLAVGVLDELELVAIGQLHVGDVRSARRLLEEEELLGAGERRRRVVGVRPVLDGRRLGGLGGRLRGLGLDLDRRAATRGERENEDKGRGPHAEAYFSTDEAAACQTSMLVPRSERTAR